MMEKIVQCVKYTAGGEDIDQEIIDSLEIMILKARHEITKPSYVPISGRLGMNVPISEQTGPSYRYNAGLMTPIEAAEYEQSLMAEILKPKGEPG
jgi:hypothetical protein